MGGHLRAAVSVPSARQLPGHMQGKSGRRKRIASFDQASFCCAAARGRADWRRRVPHRVRRDFGTSTSLRFPADLPRRQPCAARPVICRHFFSSRHRRGVFLIVFPEVGSVATVRKWSKHLMQNGPSHPTILRLLCGGRDGNKASDYARLNRIAALIFSERKRLLTRCSRSV